MKYAVVVYRNKKFNCFLSDIFETRADAESKVEIEKRADATMKWDYYSYEVVPLHMFISFFKENPQILDPKYHY